MGEKRKKEKESENEINGQSKLCNRGHWRPAEDAKLRELVSRHGPQNWNLIAKKLEGRSGKSCRLRWFNQLDPRINKRAFTEEEEDKLLSAHNAYGNKWAIIARFFPGRTDNAVKNHWHVITARKQRENPMESKKRRNSSNSDSNPSISCSNNYARSDASVSDLSHNSSIINIRFSERFQPQQAFGLFIGSDEKTMNLRNGYCCDASASESSADNRDGNQEGEKFILPFFDFLGVGAT